MAKTSGPFRTDLALMALTLVAMFLLYVAVDLPGDIPEYYPKRFQIQEEEGEAPTQIVTEELLNETEYLAEGDTREFRFEVVWWNVTQLTIFLTWDDDYVELDGTANDEFELVLRRNNSEIDRTSSTGDNLEINLLTPNMGNYSVAITAISCPAIIDNPDLDRDTGNDFRVRVITQRSTVPGEVD